MALTDAIDGCRSILSRLDHLSVAGLVRAARTTANRADGAPLRVDPTANVEPYDALTPVEQTEVDKALKAVTSQQEKGLIQAAVAARMRGKELVDYVQNLASIDAGDLAQLDPTGFTGPHAVQPDQTTCGSSALVMARMLNHPAYAMYIRLGYDPVTGRRDGLTPVERFERASLEMHDRTNGLKQRGGLGLPWPKALGTHPAGLVNEMNNGGSGMPGTSYTMKYTDPRDRGDLYDGVLAACTEGHAVPVYVGNCYSPRHVVLVIGNEDDDLTIYNPANGERATVIRSEWAGSKLGGKASWDEPWGAVVPC